MTRYDKKPLTFADQLLQLQKRGLHVENPSHAMACLERIGYYRLMGYLYPMRRAHSDYYMDGATFDEAAARYTFDHGLRLLTMEAIEHVEIAVRTAATYRIGHTYGAFGHRVHMHFGFVSQRHAEWLAKVDAEVSRSREAFIDHYRKKYTEPPYPAVPIWMASEAMSLGAVSTLFSNMRLADQKAIATRFDLPAPIFKSWLHTISVVRNIAAHHGRFWNRVLGVQPKRPDSDLWQGGEEPYPTNRSYFVLQILKVLLEHCATDVQHWCDRTNQHLRSLLDKPGYRSMMGAPSNWETHPVWSQPIKNSDLGSPRTIA